MTEVLEEVLRAFTRWLNADAALKEKAAGEETPKKIITLHQEEVHEEETQKTKECKAPAIGKTISVQELVDRTGVTLRTIKNAMKRGRLPVVGIWPTMISTEGFDKDYKELYRPFWIGALTRSNDLKACRVAVNAIGDPVVKSWLPVEWYLDVSESALRQRIYKAISLNQIHSYKLSNTTFINMDELRKFSLWWVDNCHAPNKEETRAFDSANSLFCVHENDLIWSRSRVWLDQFHPAPEKVAIIREQCGKKSREINGTRYYLAECLNQKED